MNLKKLRTEEKKSQYEVCRALDIPLRSYQEYESERSQMRYSTLIKLADYFGCSIDYLLGHETQGIMHMDSFPPTQQKIIPLLQQLNESQANYVYGWCTSALGIPYDDAKPQRPW